MRGSVEVEEVHVGYVPIQDSGDYPLITAGPTYRRFKVQYENKVQSSLAMCACHL